MDFGNLRIWKSQNFRKSCVPNLKILFEPSFFLEYDKIMKSWKVEDEECPDINFSINKMYKSLDMNFVSIKKHESILSKNEPTFLFLGEVIPIIMGEVIPIH